MVYFTILLTSLNLGKAVFGFFRDLINLYFSYQGTKKLHKEMIIGISKASINLYFDITPLGRIITRFSKDLSILENNITGDTKKLFNTIWILF